MTQTCGCVVTVHTTGLHLKSCERSHCHFVDLWNSIASMVSR